MAEIFDKSLQYSYNKDIIHKRNWTHSGKEFYNT